MKLFLSVLSLVSVVSIAAQAKTISCTINPDASEKLVAEKLKKQPWKIDRTGDDGAILVSGLEQFTLNIKNNKVASAEIVDMLAGGDDVLTVDKDGNTNSDDHRVSISLKDNKISFDMTSYYDSFEYSVYMSKDGKSATLKGSFDYDCGGEGSDVYAVYSCEW